MTEQVEEIMLLTQEAYKLASAACHFDRMQNYVGACDYYDKCLLNMDEVLNKLPPDSAEWKRLYEMRTKYDDRMELLRDNDNANSFSLTALAGGKPESSKTSLKLPRNRRKLTDAETDFKDIDWNEASEESTPEDPSEAIYWILRNVRKTMDQGGFLTKDIFIPKRVWMQQDVKFSGLGAKSAAFDIILKLISGHVEALYLSVDEDSLDLAEASFLAVYEELVALQNNLSKPFPYIKELKISDNKEEAVEASGSSGATGAQPKGPNGSGRAATLSSFVSSFGKNVRKYAEVSFQRLVVALPSKLSAEELEEYVALVTKLCDKCQIFSTWYAFIKTVAAEEAAKPGYVPPVPAGTDSTRQSLSAPGPATDGSQPVAVKAETIRTALVGISAALRDVVVEILFRDIEYLLDKYMTDMRKAFSRMYWDDDLDAGES